MITRQCNKTITCGQTSHYYTKFELCYMSEVLGSLGFQRTAVSYIYFCLYYKFISSAGIIVHLPMCNISDTGILTLHTVYSYDDDFSLVVLDNHRRVNRGSYRPTSPLRDYQVDL